MNVLRLSLVLWRESVRNKVFWLFALAGALVMMAALVLGEMVVGRPGKAVWDLGLSAINLLSLSIVITFGVSMSSREVEGRMMQLLLVKPLTRRQYLNAVFTTLLILIIIASLFVSLLTWALLGFDLAAATPLLAAMVWNLLEMAVMAAIVLFCAAFCSPQLAMFLALCLYVIGHSLQEALHLVSLNGTALVRWLISVLYLLLPNLSFFNVKSRIAAGMAMPTLLWPILYSACCVLIWGWMAHRIFERREL